MLIRTNWCIVGVTVTAGLSLLAGLAASAEQASDPAAQTSAAPAVDTASMDDGAKIISQFFATHCVSCHGEERKKADLVLHIYTDRKSILEGRKLVQHGLEMVQAGEMPPDSKPQPTVDELHAFEAAVTQFYATADSAGGVNPGRVTARRLNRLEYNNTIRDLLGVDSNPANDFPNDDIGHGFDNIGDVLTISPVLMDRYLTAAEAVSRGAILLSAPELEPLRLNGGRLEPDVPRVLQSRPRPLVKGEAYDRYRASMDGAFTVHAKVYARTVDDEPVRATLLANGKPIGTHEITADDSKDAQEIASTLRLDAAGDLDLGIRIENPSADADESDVRPSVVEGKSPSWNVRDGIRVLYVSQLSLLPPEDTRPMQHRRIIGWADADADRAEQTRQIVRKLASGAYRRPATDDEVERLAELVESVQADGESWEAGLQVAIQAVLSSPKFLFRLELDESPAATEARPLGDYALASRLSYFIWSSMPDDQLFDLAAKGQLQENLDAQVRRMLKDPKAKALVESFAMQWLQLQRLQSFSPDLKMFPRFDESLRKAMATETELFIGEIVREDRSILDLIDADFTYLSERLARHYGIVDTNGNTSSGKPQGEAGGRFPRDDDEFVRVSLPKGSVRGGLLTQASVLAVTSNPTRTSPVKRGKWVLEQILGAPPPPPPPDVPELEEDGEGVATGSLRQRLEEHRANPACANCHAKMDPIGFAFEHFDPIGHYREKDGEFPIDASAEMPDGTRFDGPAELRQMLVEKRKDEFTHALSERLLIYAVGRGLEYYDAPTVAKISQGVVAGDYRFSSLVTEIVKSPAFRMRTAAEADVRAAADGG